MEKSAGAKKTGVVINKIVVGSVILLAVIAILMLKLLDLRITKTEITFLPKITLSPFNSVTVKRIKHPYSGLSDTQIRWLNETLRSEQFFITTCNRLEITTDFSFMGRKYPRFEIDAKYVVIYLPQFSIEYQAYSYQFGHFVDHEIPVLDPNNFSLYKNYCITINERNIVVNETAIQLVKDTIQSAMEH